MRNCFLVMILFFTLNTIAQQKESKSSIQNILQTKKVTWDFQEIPLQELFFFIQNILEINIVLNPEIVDFFNEEEIQTHFQVKDALAQDALELLLEFYGLTYAITDEILYISFAKQKKAQVTKVHSLAFLEQSPSNTTQSSLVARRLVDGIWLPYTVAEQIQLKKHLPQREIRKKNSQKEPQNYISPCLEDNSDLIRSLIARESWELENHNISIFGRNIIITTTPLIQHKIHIFLEQIQKFLHPNNVGCEIWSFEIDNAFFFSSGIYPSSFTGQEILNQILKLCETKKARLLIQKQFTTQEQQLIPISYDGSEYQYRFALRPTLQKNEKILLEIASIMAQKNGDQNKITFQNAGTTCLLPKNKILPLFMVPISKDRSWMTFARVSSDPWKPESSFLETKKVSKIEKLPFEKKISVNFQQTPLEEAFHYLSKKTGINILIHPKVYEESGKLEPIDLVVSKLSIKTILDLIVHLKGLSYSYKKNMFIISPGTNSEPEPSPLDIKFYDTRDFHPTPHYQFFNTGKSDTQSFASEHLSNPNSEDFALYDGSENSINELQNLIVENIYTESWDKEGRILTNWGKILIASQSPAILLEIDSFFQQLRKRFQQQRRLITMWIYFVSPDQKPTQLALLSTFNHQKVFLQGGRLLFPGIDETHRQRVEEIKNTQEEIWLQDIVEKREGISFTAYPTIQKNKILLSFHFTHWGSPFYETETKVSIQNGKTIPIATFPSKKGPITLYLGAQISEE